MIYKSYLVEQNINLLKENFILFYGENLGLKNDLKENIKLKNRDAEIIAFTQESVLSNEENFFSEIFNISLFEKEKVYFIDQSSDKILDVVLEIEPKINQQKIYLFADILDKKSKLRSHFEKSKNSGAVACYPDNEITVKKIIHNKLKGFEGLSSQNINIIIDRSNLDRSILNNEIDKIIIYFKDKKIDYDKLEVLLDIKINNDFNIISNQALLGNKTSTNKLLGETIIDNEKNIFYLSIINNKLNKLAETYELSKTVSIEEAINMLKPPIFWKEKTNFIAQTKKWNSYKINNILKKTYDLEIEIKSNASVNKNILMKNLLIDICRVASS